MRKVKGKVFGGLKTIVNPRLIGKMHASAGLDFRVDRGDLDWRSGWDRLRAAVTGFTASYGLFFARAISSTGTVTDRYISIETVSAVTKAWELNPDTGVRTEITKSGPTAQTLHASEWGMVGWRDKVYIFNENDTTVPLAEYTPGDTDSLTIITRPDPPATGEELTYTATYPDDPLDWSAVANADFTFTGVASSAASIGDFDFNIIHTGSTGAASWELDWEVDLGNQDYSYADVFTFTAQYFAAPSTHGFRVDWSSFVFTLTNDDGSPTAFELEILDQVTGFDGALINSKTWLLRFAPDSDRTLRDNIKKLKVAYTVTAVSSDPPNFDVLEFLYWTKGGCDINSAVGAVDFMDVHYVYRIDSSSTNSNLGPAVRIPFDTLKGFPAPGGFTNKWMGYKLTLTALASDQAAVDKWQIYASFVPSGQDTGTVRGAFGTNDDSGAGLTPTWGLSYDEYLLASTYEETLTVNIETTGIVDMAVYKNWMVLARRGGVNNIRHSWSNKPLFFAFAGQSDTNLTRGVDQTLGKFGSDDPVKIVVCGEHIFIGGGRAVYGIVGANYPPELGNPIPLPNSQGFAGRNAACSFTSDNGMAGCAYLGKDFDTIWFAWIDAGFVDPTDDTRHRLVELSKDIRGYIKQNVFGGSNPSNTNEIFLYTDERGDCLILQYRSHKLVWRRDVDGERQWEPYTYEQDGAYWLRTVEHIDHGIRHVSSDGGFDESEYDKSAGFALFTGDTPDNGLEMPSTGRYWQSADFGGEAMRPFRVWLEKENKDSEWEVDLIDHDGTVIETVFVDAGHEYALFSPDVGSRSRRYRIRAATGSGKCYQYEVEEAYAKREL